MSMVSQTTLYKSPGWMESHLQMTQVQKLTQGFQNQQEMLVKLQINTWFLRNFISQMATYQKEIMKV